MAALSVSAIRQRMQAQISTSLGAQGWKPSRFVPQLFGRDTDMINPKVFSVGIGRTDISGDRQRATEGTMVYTELVVRFAWRLRADAQILDFDAALDAEEDLMVACMSASQIDLHIRLEGIPARQVSPDGDWFLGELTFRAQHRLALL